MSKHEYLTQCEIRKPDVNGHCSVDTIWIPEEFAVVGNKIKVKYDDVNWDTGWIVHATYDTMPATYINERSQDYKRTRKASDI